MISSHPYKTNSIGCGNCHCSLFLLEEIRSENKDVLIGFETICSACGLRASITTNYVIEKVTERVEYTGADNYTKKL